MKKNSFVEGAFIATLGIVICKALGLIYVIPFYSIIGSKGGALYSYAYSIYAIFLSLSTAGVPIAIAKITSEYDALGENYAKKQVLKTGIKIMMILGIICFIILMLFAPSIAYLIIGNTYGGNTIGEVSTAIRVVSFTLLVVPFQSVVRGYFQGHKVIKCVSISQVIEQLVRIVVIVAGSYISVKLLGFSKETAVYIAISGAVIGAIASFQYILIKYKKYKDQFINEEEVVKKIETKEIVKKIILCAIPFIAIDLIRSLQGAVDSITVIKTLVSLGYETSVAEQVLSVLVTWGSKLNMIVISISLGLTVSLIPNISSSFAKKDYKDINKKINQTIQIILLTAIPLAVTISLLSQQIWVIFYGYNKLSISIFSFMIIQSVFYSLYSVLINISQAMSQNKLSLFCIVGCFIGKLFLNIPFMHLTYTIGVGGYFGPNLCNILLDLFFILVILFVLKKKYNFNYKSILTVLVKTMIGVLMISAVILLLNIVITPSTTRFMSAIQSGIYFIIVGIIYLMYSLKSKLIYDIFGREKVIKTANKLIDKVKRLKK